MTTVVETNLETARTLFLSHCAKCNHCKGFNHSARAMGGLCYAGTDLFHKLLNAENDYIAAQKVPKKPITSFRHRGFLKAMGLQAET